MSKVTEVNLENDSEQQFKDMTGDKVYDYLSSSMKEGYKVIGARKLDKKYFGPKEARSILTLQIKEESSGQKFEMHVNYKKVERRLNAHEKYGWAMY